MGMVQAMHRAISCGADVRRALREKAAPIEKFLPAARHGKVSMCRIPVHKEGLEEQRYIPVHHKKNQNSHKRLRRINSTLLNETEHPAIAIRGKYRFWMRPFRNGRVKSICYYGVGHEIYQLIDI